MLNRIKSEPALVSGAVQAVLGLLLAFGVKLTDVQTAAILAVTAALLALVVRSKVTPVAGDAGEDGAIDPGSAALGLVVGLIIAYLVLR
jgi:hypothetical protein